MAITKTTLATLLLAAIASAKPVISARATVFDLENIVLTQTDEYSSPPHISSYSNTISFTLVNTATSTSTSCSATETGNFADEVFTGQKTYTCEDGDSAFTFDYNDSAFIFTVTDDTNASGSGQTSDFTCSTVDDVNPDWTPTNGELYKTETITCSASDLEITSS